MLKTFIFHHLLDWNDLPAAERWFYRYHIPEVLRNMPSSYVSYRSVPPPPGAETYGYYNYKVHENVNLGESHPPMGLLAMTPEVVPLKVIMVDVPVSPTEDFFGKGSSFEEKTILRWLVVFKYPEGVSAIEGDEWYLKVHVNEVMKQPGLTRFFSYRIIPSRMPGPSEGRSFLHSRSSMSTNWYRVSEQWYENSNGWVESIIKSPPKYTRPSWAKYDRYPFLEPDKDFASTFILEKPSNDWVKEVSRFYI